MWVRIGTVRWWRSESWRFAFLLFACHCHVLSPPVKFSFFFALPSLSYSNITAFFLLWLGERNNSNWILLIGLRRKVTTCLNIQSLRGLKVGRRTWYWELSCLLFLQPLFSSSALLVCRCRVVPRVRLFFLSGKICRDRVTCKVSKADRDLPSLMTANQNTRNPLLCG